MTPVPILPDTNNNDEDAAMIDSFFLPGGILDPDDEEEEVDSPITLLSPTRNLTITRVPSNPWCYESSLEQTKSDADESSKDPFLLDSTNNNSEDHFVNVSLTKPFPGYNDPRGTLFGWETVNCRTTSSLPIQHNPENNNIKHSQHSQSSLKLAGPIKCPPPGFQDRTIRRPPTQSMSNTAHAVPGQHGLLQDIRVIHDNENNHNNSGVTTPSIPFIQNTSQTNHFISYPNSDICKAASNDEKSVEDLWNSAYNERETATSLEGSALESEVEEEDENDDEEEDDDDDEDDDIDESTDEDASFPIEMLIFVSGSSHTNSLTSSLSSSSSSSSELDESQHSYEGENEEEKAQALDSAVAVILDFNDSQKDSYGGIQSEENGSLKQNQYLEEAKTQTPDSMRMKAKLTEKLSMRTFSFSNNWTESTLSSRDPPIPDHVQEVKPITFSSIKVWLNNFHEYMAWMENLFVIIGPLFSFTWTALCLLMNLANKIFVISALFFLQSCKFALIELIEEPQVTTCYVIFYFMPWFCSLLRELVIIPHWTPHFITSIAVWSLCTLTPPGPLYLEHVSICRIVGQASKSCGVTSINMRPRDKRACTTILRILRFVLPIFFFADGFSTEFGTIMGVSGSSRLTTAYMMSLVRKSLVSSSVGWASWAVQVLLATHHPSSFLVDFLVLICGLSSIRLIRYLEIRRAGTKKRDDKDH